MLHEYLLYGGYGPVETEYRFHPVRKWRADFYLPGQQPPVIVEYDGLTAATARNRSEDDGNASHGSIGGILRDAEKGNEAQALGIRFYRFNAKTVWSGDAFKFLDRVLSKVEP